MEPSDVPRSPSPDAVRRRAKLWNFFCPGGGFLVLGRRTAGVVTAAFPFLMLGSLCGFALHVSVLTFWLFVGLTGLALLTWFVEYVAIRRIPPPAGGKSISAKVLAGVLVATLGLGVFAIVLLVTCTGTLRVVGEGMSPTILPGERAVFQRRGIPPELTGGQLVFFRRPAESSWGEQGHKVLARILAVPGDTISVWGGRFVVNGSPGPRLGYVGGRRMVIDVPDAPRAITVPADCYFVVQDGRKGIDSRVLSWVKKENIVGARFLLFSRRGIAKELK